MPGTRKAPRNVCGRKAKKTKEPCGSTALCENGACRVHGGKTPAGAESPNFVHGRYSRKLPDRFAQHYAEAQASTDLLVLKDDVALMDAQIAARLVALKDDGDSEGFRRQALDSFSAVVRAIGDAGKLKDAVAAHAALLERGANEFDALAEVNGLVNTRARLVELERGHHLRQQAAVSLDEMRVLMAAIHESIRRNVVDPQLVEKIAREVQRLVGGDLDAAPATH